MRAASPSTALTHSIRARAIGVALLHDGRALSTTGANEAVVVAQLYGAPLQLQHRTSAFLGCLSPHVNHTLGVVTNSLCRVEHQRRGAAHSLCLVMLRDASAVSSRVSCVDSIRNEAHQCARANHRAMLETVRAELAIAPRRLRRSDEFIPRRPVHAAEDGGRASGDALRDAEAHSLAMPRMERDRLRERERGRLPTRGCVL